MEALRSYFALMLFLCLAAGLSGALLHEHAKDISLFAIGVIFLSSLASPLMSVISEAGEIPLPDNETAIPSGGISDTIEESFVLGVERYIASEWGLSREDVSVSIGSFSALDVRAGKLSVELSRAGVFIDTRSMREELFRQFVLPDGECTVVIGFD